MTSMQQLHTKLKALKLGGMLDTLEGRPDWSGSNKTPWASWTSWSCWWKTRSSGGPTSAWPLW